MARPKKQGLDYFPLDSQFLSDIKVRKIMRAQGTNAISVLISLLCNIYKDEGYYVQRDDEVSFLIADEIGVKEEYVNEIIDKAIQVGFFDKHQYDVNKILTSNGIQKRFFEATERRKYVVFNANFLVNVNRNTINANNNSINDDRSTQSKVKESKVKESKVEIIDGGSAFADIEKPFTKISEKEFYNSLKPFIRDFDKTLIREFYDYWREPTADKKMRFQKEKAWDVKRRLSTWKKKDSQFSNVEKTTVNTKMKEL